MGCSGAFLYSAPPAYAAGYERVNGYYQMLDGTVIDGVVARGIDVSRWQGNIDWNTVAADDVEFVMLGTRSKGAVDPYFHKNVKELPMPEYGSAPIFIRWQPHRRWLWRRRISSSIW